MSKRPEDMTHPEQIGVHVIPAKQLQSPSAVTFNEGEYDELESL